MGCPYDSAAAVAHLRAADPVLAGVIGRVGPFALELQPARTLFQALLRSIVYQQLHGKAVASIHARVQALLRQRGGLVPAALEAAGDGELRIAGLSRAKLAALRDLAAKCRGGAIPTLAAARRLSDEELIDRLCQVRGIGPWSVHMLLIFTLGRPDVLPTGDYAIRLAFGRLYRRGGTPPPAAISRHAEAWRPYRSVACWYLWRSLDTG